MLEQRGWADADTAHALAFTADSNRLADIQTAQAIAHQRAQWQLADTRAAQEAAYQSALTAIDQQITDQQKLAADEAERLKATQQLATMATTADDALAGAASHAIDIANTINSISTADTSSSNSFPGQPVQGQGTGIKVGVSGYAAGGIIKMTEPYSIVGDGPGGAITPYTEIVSAPGYAVTPLRHLFEGTASGGTAHPAITHAPNYNITIVQQPGEDAVALWARLKPLLDQYQQANSMATEHAATGGVR